MAGFTSHWSRSEKLLAWGGILFYGCYIQVACFSVEGCFPRRSWGWREGEEASCFRQAGAGRWQGAEVRWGPAGTLALCAASSEAHRRGSIPTTQHSTPRTTTTSYRWRVPRDKNISGWAAACRFKGWAFFLWHLTWEAAWKTASIRRWSEAHWVSVLNPIRKMSSPLMETSSIKSCLLEADFFSRFKKYYQISCHEIFFFFFLKSPKLIILNYTEAYLWHVCCKNVNDPWPHLVFCL